MGRMSALVPAAVVDRVVACRREGIGWLPAAGKGWGGGGVTVRQRGECLRDASGSDEDWIDECHC
eukprot:352838-Chlamydomonas_euryale.AAC.2